MKCSVFIATSADGFIATHDGDVQWLETAGDSDADMTDDADMGFVDFIQSVDCMIMGRKCMDKISSMNLTDEQWPYGDLRIIVLSNTLTTPPINLLGKVEMYRGDVSLLIEQLHQEGYHHAYIDGGTTIQHFIDLQLIQDITITQAPIFLGDGIPLFGKTSKTLTLEHAKAKAFSNNFIQTHYQINYE